MKDLVTRAISGHATPAMQSHYSTVAANEVEAGLAKVVSLAGVRRALGRRGGVGRKLGGKATPKKKAARG